MLKKAIIFEVIFLEVIFLSVFITAQPRSLSERVNKTAVNLYSAVSENLRWYDLPIGAVYLSDKYFAPGYDDRIRISSGGLDGQMQKQIGKSGRFSFGSMDKNTIPYSILLSRVFYNVGYDLLSGNNDGRDNHRHTFLFYKSLIYTYTLTEFVKSWTIRQRPDGTDKRSFFSGHSSTSFAAASFLFREANDIINREMPERSYSRLALKSASFSLLYGWASYVAFSRMRDNKHYFSDVLIGALAGTAVSNLVYNGYITDRDRLVELNLGIINRAPTVSLTIGL